MLWYSATDPPATYPNPTNYGYERKLGFLAPVIIPYDFMTTDLAIFLHHAPVQPVQDVHVCVAKINGAAPNFVNVMKCKNPYYN